MNIPMEMKVVTKPRVVEGNRYPTVTAQVVKRTTVVVSRTDRMVFEEGEVHPVFVKLRRESPPQVGDIIQVDPSHFDFHEV